MGDNANDGRQTADYLYPLSSPGKGAKWSGVGGMEVGLGGERGFGLAQLHNYFSGGGELSALSAVLVDKGGSFQQVFVSSIHLHNNRICFSFLIF